MDAYVKANAVFSLFAKNYMELKRNLPIRPSEMGVLNILTQTDGPHTPVMLAEMLGVSKPMITAHIASLEQKGYLTKEPSTQDKRVYYIHPTARANTLVNTAKTEMNGHLTRLINELGPHDFDALVALVDTANTILTCKGDDDNGSQR